MITKQLKICK